MNAGSVCVVLGALALSQSALADDSGAYIGVNVGHVDMPDDVRLGVPDVASLSGDSKSTGLALSMEVGYRFNRNLAVEVGLVDLDVLVADVADPTGGSDASAQLGFKADGVSVALVGIFPIDKWEPYVKAGVLFSDTTLTYTGSVGGSSFGASIDNESEDALYGVGVRYSVTERLRLYLDATYFMEVGEPERGQVEYIKTAAGVIWQF
ncbi:MAG: porin family protein [Steroidobacter sp.]